MSHETASTDEPLVRYREYLRLLAQVQINPRWRAQVDLSGLVQQTLLEAHAARRLTGDEPVATTMAWLRQALANNLRDELRKLHTEMRDVRREQSLEVSLAESSARLDQWLAANGSSPSQSLQREALVWQHWHGWSLAEIAAQMQRTPAAVAGLLKRGLKQLREELRND
jgi:RNA polymerase sigma-70 factor (ECF subfamily)